MYKELSQKINKTFSSLPKKSRILVVGYLTYMMNRRYSPATVTRTVYLLKDFCQNLPDNSRKDLCQVSSDDIRALIGCLHERKLSPSSINGYLSALRGLFKYLIDEDYVGKNPVLRRYFLHQPMRLPRPMDEADLKLFVFHLKKPRDRAMFLLMLRCGLRVAEVCRLKVSDIDWEHKTVIIHNGKGQVDRVVYMSKDAEAALRVWLMKRGYMNELCFLSPYRKLEQPLSTRMVQFRMQTILHECGLQGKGYGPHTLRHTFATLLLNGGMDLYVLKNLMGHKHVDQTLMYARLSNRRIHESYYQAMHCIDAELELLKEGVG
jgi:site-specific recombinase XerD